MWKAGWISASGGCFLIKTQTMQPELPCRNVGFEESLNGPFRGGWQEAAEAAASKISLAYGICLTATLFGQTTSCLNG